MVKNRGLVQPLGIPKLEISRNGFKWRSANQYNQILEKVAAFKDQAWIKPGSSLDQENSFIVISLVWRMKRL